MIGDTNSRSASSQIINDHTDQVITFEYNSFIGAPFVKIWLFVVRVIAVMSIIYMMFIHTCMGK